MTTYLNLRSAPDEKGEEACGPTGSLLDRWRRARRTRSSDRQRGDDRRRVRLEQLRALLEIARADIDAGWLQGGWWSVPTSGGRRMLVSGPAAGGIEPDAGGAVCLVGALVRAGSRQGPAGSEVGSAIDAVYDALWEARGQTSAEPDANWPRASSPQVRLARVQTLTRWNDAADRTREDVVAILDRAIARTILSLCDSPAAGVPGTAR